MKKEIHQFGSFDEMREYLKTRNSSRGVEFQAEELIEDTGKRAKKAAVKSQKAAADEQIL